LIRRKLREGVACAAFLKTSGALEVVELAKDLHARDFAQRNRWRTGRIINGAFDALARRLDILESHNHVAIYAAIVTGNVLSIT